MGGSEPMSALDNALGRPGEPVECKVGKYVTVHWYPSDARPGDPCLCGEMTMAVGPAVERDTETET